MCPLFVDNYECNKRTQHLFKGAYYMKGKGAWFIGVVVIPMKTPVSAAVYHTRTKRGCINRGYTQPIAIYTTTGSYLDTQNSMRT